MSCKSDKQDKVIEGKNVMPKAKEENSTRLQSTSVAFFDTVSFANYLKQDSINLPLKTISMSKSKGFLDRFATDSSIILSLQNDVHTHMDLEIHFYKDSNQSKNAFFNWLDEQKNSVVGNQISLNTRPTVYILTEKHFQIISSISSFNIEKIWKLSRFFSRKDQLIFFVSSNRKGSKWWKLEKNKLIEIAYENNQ